MADGRTTYHAKDDAWHLRERVVTLGVEFGAAGAAVLDFLECQAGLQRDQGRVRTGMLAISRSAFVNDPQLTRQIVERAVEIGALDDLEHHSANTFTVRVSGWQADQTRAAAARRQSAKRERDTDLSRPVTQRHGSSRSVTPVTRSRADAETSADDDARRLQIVTHPENGGDTPPGGETANPADSRALSRPVTQRHGSSRHVTKSHVKSRTELTTTPPQPPASGGRRRDEDRARADYQQHLAAFLDEHPCTHDAATVTAWQTIVAKLTEPNRSSFAAIALTGSHPHATTDGTLLIGLTPDMRRHVKGRERVLRQLVEQHTPDRHVAFVECPAPERTAAAS